MTVIFIDWLFYFCLALVLADSRSISRYLMSPSLAEANPDFAFSWQVYRSSDWSLRISSLHFDSCVNRAAFDAMVLRFPDQVRVNGLFLFD